MMNIKFPESTYIISSSQSHSQSHCFNQHEASESLHAVSIEIKGQARRF